MQALKSLIQKTKKDVQEFKKDKKWVSQKDVRERERAEAIKAKEETEEKQKQRELKRLKELEEHFNNKKRRLGDKNNSTSHKEAESERLTLGDNDDREKEVVPISKEEVVQRLRRKGQVVTYFGETDWKRYRRLCELEIAEHGDEMAGGQQNLFLRLLEDGGQKRSGRRISDAAVFDEDFDDDDNEKRKQGESDKKNETIPKLLTKEEHIRAWIRRMLNEWESELQERTEEERNTQLGKIKTAQCKQTRKDLRPLMKKLKQKDLDSTILEKIDAMVSLCEEQEYKAAHDKYIELSIGNAAWPMGVTMVGIHERAGRSKIFTSEIAHVLNDETTRKYIHMFKRLISFCQRKYPTDPSQMVSISTTHI